MTKNILRSLPAMFAATALLHACASTPQEASQAPEPVQSQTANAVPPPVFESPETMKEAPPAPPPPPIERTDSRKSADIGPIQITPPGPTPGTPEHFEFIAGSDRVYFDTDQYELTPQSREVLRKQAEWLKEFASAITIVGGHADERGTREYNLALAARRAAVVKAFFIRHGVLGNRITTVSYGKERPIDGGSNEAAWALNRNAHTTVLVRNPS